MMKKNFFLIIFTSLIFLSCKTSFAQHNFLNQNRNEKKEQNNFVLSIFNQIELGISTGTVSKLSEYLNTQTYLSLSNGISGYYSSNQAFYILEDFLNIYKVSSFHFQNIQANENLPYAIGIYKYSFRGKTDSANVYISLKNIGNSWKITQITIN
jgi:hypothetical protein